MKKEETEAPELVKWEEGSKEIFKWHDARSCIMISHTLNGTRIPGVNSGCQSGTELQCEMPEKMIAHEV